MAAHGLGRGAEEQPRSQRRLCGLRRSGRPSCTDGGDDVAVTGHRALDHVRGRRRRPARQSRSLPDGAMGRQNLICACWLQPDSQCEWHGCFIQVRSWWTGIEMASSPVDEQGGLLQDPSGLACSQQTMVRTLGVPEHWSEQRIAMHPEPGPCQAAECRGQAAFVLTPSPVDHKSGF